MARLGLACAIVLLAVRILLSATPALAQCAPEWLPGEGTAGLDGNGAVLAATSWDPDGAGPEPALLVVAGGFWAAGDVAASNIAAWDGQKWRTLGNVNGSEVWDVRALIVYNGQLIAAGGFSTGFGSPANCIARFDVATQSWKPLAGGGMNATVRALAIYNGDLVAAGFFTTAGGQAANHVARWNGTSWSQVGPGLPNTMISLAVLGGDLIAGASGVFRWNGTSWQQLGPTISVDVMAVHNGELYAGGGFTISSGGPADHIARWNGSSWQPLGAGLDDAPFALITYGNHLVAGGIFDHAGGIPVAGLAQWDGSSWDTVGGGGALQVWSLAVYNNELIMGGTETRASGEASTHISRWNGSGWNLLGSGANSVVMQMIEYNGYLYMAGGFTSVRGVDDARGLVRRATTSEATPWEPVGAGLAGGEFGVPFVTQMAVFNGSLIVAGDFNFAGGSFVNGIARWDGTAWHAFAANAQGQMIVFHNELYAAGTFPGSRVGKLVGTQWQPVGTMPSSYAVNCLTVYNDQLIAAGFAGVGPPSTVFRWDGTTWNPMGPQMGERVFALEVYNGELYAGGFFLNGVSKWTGSQWVAAGGGIPNSAVRDIMVYGNDLIAVGDFLYEPGSPMRNIARFNGTSWQPVGLGIGFEGATTDDPGFTLATFGDELVVGGWFTVADHKPNAYWAHFGCEATTGVPVVPSTTRLSMRGPWPQPARESFNVSFTLPTASRATIELIDLMGRRIERQDVGSFGIGSHQVTFGRTRPLSPGVYMVRLTQGEASASVKAVVLP